MFQFAQFMHQGAQERQFDRLQVMTDEAASSLYGILADGVNSSRYGDVFAEMATDICMKELRQGRTPAEAIMASEELLAEAQAQRAELHRASCTLSVLFLSGFNCRWANVGDSRLYHFSQGQLSHLSPDDSVSYQAYRHGGLAYEDIRLHPERNRLLASMGDGQSALPHEEAFQLQEGDGILLCSDGFWQYVYETEMLIDFAKAGTAKQWLELMLLRCIQRSLLDGDNLSVLCCLL